jgi:hypothetical protein
MGRALRVTHSEFCHSQPRDSSLCLFQHFTCTHWSDTENSLGANLPLPRAEDIILLIVHVEDRRQVPDLTRLLNTLSISELLSLDVYFMFLYISSFVRADNCIA